MWSSTEPTPTVSTTISSSSSVMRQMPTWNISPRSWRRPQPGVVWTSRCPLWVLGWSSSTRPSTPSCSDQVHEIDASLLLFRPYEVGIRLIYSLSISRQTDWIGRASSPGAFQEAGFVPGGFQLHPVPGNSDLQSSHRLQRSAAQPGATAGQQHHPLATLRQRHLQGSAGRDAWLTVRLLDIRWCNGGRTL